MLLRGKTAIITGSNKGIGKKILEVFSSNGANVYACARNLDDTFQEQINLLEKKYKNKITPIKLDLSEEGQVKESGKKILEFGDSIDILVNNAAAIHTSIFQMTPQKKLRELFEINFFSQATFTQYILKSMMKGKRGSIIYISSSAAIDGNEGRSAYASSKAALSAQSKVLSRELGPSNIRVNTIAPGLTETKMMKESTSPELIEEMKLRISLRKIGSPSEIANAALFLASEMSSYITGQTLRVDGGM